MCMHHVHLTAMRADSRCFRREFMSYRPRCWFKVGGSLRIQDTRLLHGARDGRLAAPWRFERRQFRPDQFVKRRPAQPTRHRSPLEAQRKPRAARWHGAASRLEQRTKVGGPRFRLTRPPQPASLARLACRRAAHLVHVRVRVRVRVHVHVHVQCMRR